MMALMFVLGAMNVVWMAVLGVVMTIEKLSTTAQFSQAIGVVFVAAGFIIVAVSAV
jgi:predicted metal-binding membrane protein